MRTVEEVEEVLRKDAELMAQVRATEESAAGFLSADAEGKSARLDGVAAQGMAAVSAAGEHVWHHLSSVDRKQLGAGAHEALVRLADAVHKAEFYTRTVADAARRLCAVQVDRALIDDAVAKHAAVEKKPVPTAAPETSLLEQALMDGQMEGKESHFTDMTISADLRGAK